MPSSPAQIEANRSNAQRSTGPRTDEGKERSRANAFKHGLTGSGVVLDDADRSAFERKRRQYLAELAPSTTLGADLVDRAAVLVVRLDRARRFDEARAAYRARHAVDRFDDDASVACRAYYEVLCEIRDRDARRDQFPDLSPALLVRRLMRSAEGIDLLAQGWHNLRRVVVAEARNTRFALDVPTRRLFLRLGGSDVDNRDVTPHDRFADRVRQSEATPGEILAYVDDRLADLAAAREAAGLDDRAEADRAEAPERALFDDSREGEMIRRYEVKAENALFRTLDQLRRVESPAGPSRPPTGAGSARPADPPLAPESRVETIDIHAGPPIEPPDQEDRPGLDPRTAGGGSVDREDDAITPIDADADATGMPTAEFAASTPRPPR